MAILDNNVADDCVSSPFLNSIAGLQNTELISSPDPYSKLDSFDQKQELEKEFCRDFICCGLNLGNLHQLLEHYEEYHLSHNSSSSGSDDDELEHNNYSNKSSTQSSPIIEDGTSMLLQQPMHLAHFTSTASLANKEHLTKYDINMLENARKYASRRSVQTLDSIVDHLNTPSLSPSETTGYRGDNYFDEELSSSSSNRQWYQRTPNHVTIPSLSNNSEDQSDNKPYRCHIVDCDKAYKNANGLKYHRLHGHCPPSDGNEPLDASKPYNCFMGNCRKRYKNLNGLKYHIEHTHMTKIHNLSSDMFFNKTQQPEDIINSLEDPEEEHQSIAKSRKRRRYSSVSTLSSSSSVISSETSSSL